MDFQAVAGSFALVAISEMGTRLSFSRSRWLSIQEAGSYHGRNPCCSTESCPGFFSGQWLSNRIPASYPGFILAATFIGLESDSEA
jgi:hypothetical protein